MFSQYIKNIIIKTYKRNVQCVILIYFWHKHEKKNTRYNSYGSYICKCNYAPFDD
jgi:hypothetical protein